MFSQSAYGNPRRSDLSNMYSHVGVESAVVGDHSPHRLVSLLFEDLLASIAKARGAIARGDVALKCSAIGKAVRIVDEGLKAPLDLKAGGSLAQSLRELYDYMQRRLTHANLRSDDAALAECARLTETLREGWEGIAEQVRPARAVAAVEAA